MPNYGAIIVGGTTLGKTPVANMDVRGSVAGTSRVLTGSETLGFDDFAVDVDASSASVTATLPDASTCAGRIYWIYCLDDTNAAYFAPASGQTVDGATGAVQIYTGESFTIRSDGTSDWRL